jgi:hypothetical protein
MQYLPNRRCNPTLTDGTLAYNQRAVHATTTEQRSAAVEDACPLCHRNLLVEVDGLTVRTACPDCDPTL